MGGGGDAERGAGGGEEAAGAAAGVAVEPGDVSGNCSQTRSDSGGPRSEFLTTGGHLDGEAHLEQRKVQVLMSGVN